MHSQNDESSGRRGWARVSSAGAGALRVTLLFGSVALALALLLTPLLERKTHNTAAFDTRLDNVKTGSVGRGRSAYTVRRSVLQASPDSVCIISADGSRRGDC
ncbi:hypothetical protein [Nitratireductor sp. GCM10026969]|uniref:hypothetical protein n=1 Tax=Nitratireductor sp. GCM10026969 TaxID=3252645 RepID=UPI00360CE2C3